MNAPLRVLHLEDDVRDAKLVHAALVAEGIPIELTRVETELDFVSALNRGGCDLILADYTLPSFDGLSALRIAQRQLPDVPFIFVSGTLGEEVAIEALKTGATDFVLKTRLRQARACGQAGIRELREKARRMDAEEALRRSEKELRNVIDTIPTFAWTALPDGSIDFANRYWVEFTGLSIAESIGQVGKSPFTPRTWGEIGRNGSPRLRPVSRSNMRCVIGARMGSIVGFRDTQFRCGMCEAESSSGMASRLTLKIASGQKPCWTGRNKSLRWWRKEIRFPKYWTVYAGWSSRKPAALSPRSYWWREIG